MKTAKQILKKACCGKGSLESGFGKMRTEPTATEDQIRRGTHGGENMTAEQIKVAQTPSPIRSGPYNPTPIKFPKIQVPMPKRPMPMPKMPMPKMPMPRQKPMPMPKPKPKNRLLKDIIRKRVV